MIRICLADTVLPVRRQLKPKEKSRLVRSGNGVKDRDLGWLTERRPWTAGLQIMRVIRRRAYAAGAIYDSSSACLSHPALAQPTKVVFRSLEPEALADFGNSKELG